MKFTEPAIIGYPAKGGPNTLGVISGLDFPRNILIGSLLKIKNIIFMVNVCYIPENPKRETTVLILEPKEEIPKSFWSGTAVKIEKEPVVQEEFPF